MVTLLLGLLNIEIIFILFSIPCAILMKLCKEKNKNILKFLSITNILSLIIFISMNFVNSNLLYTASKIFPW